MTGRVLLVDDDASNLLTLSALLEDEGLEVSCASDGAQARALVAGGARFGAAVVDLNLGRESGLALLAALREAHGPLPALLLTGQQELPAGSEAVDGVVHKGEDFQVLSGKLRALLK